MTSNTQAPTRDVDEVLQNTELGSYIAKNKGIVIGAIIGILIAIVGHGFYNESKKSTNDAFNEKIYNFESQSLVAYQENSIKSDELISKLSQLKSEMGTYSGLTLLVFNTSDSLVKNKELDKAFEALQMATSSDPYTSYFLATRKAAVLEDLNKPAEALAELEAMPEASKKLLEGKVYLDMGRLQLKTGDKESAKRSFEYLQDKIVQDDFAKMANYYLYEISKGEPVQANPVEVAPTENTEKK